MYQSATGRQTVTWRSYRLGFFTAHKDHVTFEFIVCFKFRSSYESIRCLVKYACCGPNSLLLFFLGRFYCKWVTSWAFVICFMLKALKAQVKIEKHEWSIHKVCSLTPETWYYSYLPTVQMYSHNITEHVAIALSEFVDSLLLEMAFPHIL